MGKLLATDISKLPSASVVTGLSVGSKIPSSLKVANTTSTPDTASLTPALLSSAALARSMLVKASKATRNTLVILRIKSYLPQWRSFF